MQSKSIIPITSEISTAPKSHFDADGALRHIQAQARYFFEPLEFAALTGKNLETAGVKKALVRLSRQGRIVLATKRPTGWLIVPPEHQHYGAPPVDWWLDDCVKRLDANYYLGLLSAARHWGSAHQALQTNQVMLGRSHPGLSMGRLRIDFYRKTNIAATPTVVAHGTVSSWRVSTREATLLDLIRHQAAIGGIETVARVARDFSRSIDADGLTQALDAMGQVPVAQRLGFMLVHLGFDKPARRVVRWLEHRRMTLQPLALQSTEAECDEVDRDWGIRYTPRQLELVENLR